MRHEGGASPEGFPIQWLPFCAQLLEDGTLGADHASPLVASCTVGSPTWTERCPVGWVVVGFRGEILDAAPQVGRLGTICAPLADWLESGTGGITQPYPTFDPRPPRDAFDERCPDDHVVTGAAGHHGCAIDAFQIVCRHVSR